MPGRFIPKILEYPNSSGAKFYLTEHENVRFGWFSGFADQTPIDGNERQHYLELGNYFGIQDFASLHQTHSRMVKSVSKTTGFQKNGEGDGLLTREYNLALSIRTADCIPLFLIDREWIALLHAGYRGLFLGIADELHSMTEGFENVSAFLGPHIRSCCFEIQADVHKMATCVQDYREADLVHKDNRLWLDLEQIMARNLRRLGIKEIFSFQECTACNPKWHSYRRNKSPYRLGHMIFRT